MTGISPHVFSIGVDLTTEPGFYLYATYAFTDEAPLTDDNTLYNPAYALLDTKVGYATELAGLLELDAHVGIDNLLDEAYTSQASLNARAFGPPGTQAPYFNPAPTRNFYTGLSVKYLFR